MTDGGDQEVRASDSQGPDAYTTRAEFNTEFGDFAQRLEETMCSMLAPRLEETMWFEDVVSIRSMTDTFKCRFFAITFEGKARDWFHQLPTNSINRFVDLRRGFMARFTTSKKRKKEIVTLFHLKHGELETLGHYVDRFQEEVLSIQEVDGFVLQLALTCGLKQGLFNMEISTDPPESYEELIERANKFVHGEFTNTSFLARLERASQERDDEEETSEKRSKEVLRRGEESRKE